METYEMFLTRTNCKFVSRDTFNMFCKKYPNCIIGFDRYGIIENENEIIEFYDVTTGQNVKYKIPTPSIVPIMPNAQSKFYCL